MIGRLLTAAPFVLCIALYASVQTGHFLSDDMAVIYVLSNWQEHGELWSRLFSKFAAGLDSPSHYYRPLAFLSFGLNLTVDALRPLPWHLVNLAGHLAAGAAVYRIGTALQPVPAGRWGPLFAAAAFLLCGTSAETVAWISGRYDVFATAFSLWAAALYLRSRTGFDRYEFAALACGILSLASKESGVITPGLIGCLAWIRHGPLPRGERWRQIARDLAPWVVVIAAYFALRYAIFGSMLQVYPGVHPLARIASGGWRVTLDAVGPWLDAALPNPALLTAAAVLFALLLAAGFAIVVRDRTSWRRATGLLAAVVWSLALFFPHVSGLAANGEGGRLFYSTSALLALCIAVPFGAGGGEGASRPWFRPFAAVGLVALAVHAGLLHAALRDWRSAGTQMGKLVKTLPALKPTLTPGGYAFVIAPDAIGAVPFARNANGAMVLRPVQQQPLLSDMIVLLPANMSEVPDMLRRELIPTFKRYTLEEAVRRESTKPEASPGTPLVWPTEIFCWKTATGALAKVEMRPDWRDVNRWEAGVANGLRLAGCEYASRL